MRLIARLPYWTECHLEIVSIRGKYIYGKIVDNKNPCLVRDEGLFLKDNPWVIEILSDELEISLN